MQHTQKTAGQTASTITLVAIIDCHASHNVRMNVKPEEKGYIKRFLKAHGYQVVERKPKPQEPTRDYHTAVHKFLDRFSGKGRYENTFRKGGVPC